MSYITVARSLLRGHGLASMDVFGRSVQVTWFPPLYPALLSGIALFGIEVLTAARWFNAVVFGLNILLVARSAERFAPGTPALPVLAALLCLASPVLILIHSYAWTEPSFILFGLAGCLYLDAYVKDRKRSMLWAATGCFAAACLIRYVGVAYVLGALLALVVLRLREQTRLTRTLAVLVVAFLPLGLWLARAASLDAGVAGRSLRWHPPTVIHAKGFLSTAWNWLTPIGLPGVFVVGPTVAALAALSLLPLGWALKKKDVQPALLLFCATAVAYVVTLLVSITFFDASTPLDSRVLAPLFVFGFVPALFVLYRFLERFAFGKAVAVALAVLLCISYAVRSFSWTNETRETGLGYMSETWTRSDLIRQVQDLKPGTRIYSNGPDAIKLLADRSAAQLPSISDPVADCLNTDYQREIQAMRRALIEESGVIVLFEAIHWREYLPSSSDLSAALNLDIVYQSADGVIYRVKRYISQIEGLESHDVADRAC